MSRRRKRSKTAPSEGTNNNQANSPSSSSFSEYRGKEPLAMGHTKVRRPEEQILTTKKITPHLAVDELEQDLILSESDEVDKSLVVSDRVRIPPAKSKKKGLAISIDNNEIEPVKSSKLDLAKPKTPTPEKQQRPPKSTTQPTMQPTSNEDELGSLDDDGLSLPQHEGSSVQEEVAPAAEISDAAESPVAEKAPPSPAKAKKESPPEEFSFRKAAKNALNSLSLLERISIAFLAGILLVVAIWSTKIVSDSIPNAVIASKLRYPLKGNSVVLASCESYWRAPIFEGANIDKGVSQSIAIIPEVKVSLHPSSQAKSLRFLFRDEEGHLVGDSTTLNISGAKFLPSTNQTSYTKGSEATINATTGFKHAGELISYLADETFQWEIVILESTDGDKYTEFIAIPISSNRKDNS